MNKRLRKMFSWITILALMLVALPTQSTLAVSPNIVISQVYGGGGNSGAQYTNDYIELFNRGTTTVSLAGWSVQYASATGTGNFGANSGQLTELSGSIAPGQYFLVQEAAGSNPATPLPTPDVSDSTPINMSGTAGKVALANTTTSLGCNGGSAPCSPAALANIVDLVGYGGANFFEGSGAAPTLSNTTAAFRNGNGCVDTDDNAADFTADSPSPRNTASPLHSCSGPTNPTGTGAADPDMLKAGETSLLTVMVTPGANPTSSGLTVTCDLSAIGGSASQAFYDDGTNGDTAAGDNTFSYLATVDSNTSDGDKTLDCIITDAEARSGSASITATVYVILPIGTVNGPVGDMDDGTAHRSPYAPPSGNGSGQTVVVQGVIYEKTLQATSFGGTYKGFYIQNTAATADGDPHTSDGLFVFMNTFSDLIGGYVPTVGDEVVISGKISEFFNMTEMSSASLIGPVVRSGVDINAELSPIVVNPPDNLSDANRYWERLQGMRVQAPQNSIVLNGRNVFSPADAEVWVARSDSTIAQRSDPYTRRAFRDAHPLDDNYDINVWDGNGYRILLGSLGIKATENNGDALIAPARTFDTVTSSPVGGLNYTFNKYRIEITEQPTLSEGSDPAANNPPAAFDRSMDFSIADYNLENLYDYRDNPFSGCDFTNVPNNSTGSNPKCDNSGTPFIDSVTPASDGTYNYVPASDAVYQARLNDIALQIIDDLHSPDILMVQEVENQDICTVSGEEFVCGTTNNADGKPDDLQELALKIVANGGPAYDAAFDRDSSDLRGIVPAFLYRTDRVELLSPVGDPVLGGNPAIAYAGASVPYDSDISNPKTLNAQLPAGVTPCETNWVFPRAPDIGLFRIYRTSIGVGSYGDVYVINNHFKSGPDSCVTHRTEQAKYNAALVAFIQAANPDARIVVGGDLNVYPRPDDPFAPVGQPGSSDQLGALYDPSLGLTNLWNVLLGQAPEAAYSYVYQGMAQTLDQMFVNPTMLGDLTQFRIAHINSDFPADYPGDVARGTSDHDPNVATFHVIFNWTGFFSPVANPPTLNTVKAGQAVPVKFSLNGDQGLNIFAAGYPQSTVIACDSSEPQDIIDETVTAGSSSLSYDPTTDTYNYVWKTDKGWAGTCRQLVVKLVDGTYHYADFNFTK